MLYSRTRPLERDIEQLGKIWPARRPGDDGGEDEYAASFYTFNVQG